MAYETPQFNMLRSERANILEDTRDDEIDADQLVT